MKEDVLMKKQSILYLIVVLTIFFVSGCQNISGVKNSDSETKGTQTAQTENGEINKDQSSSTAAVNAEEDAQAEELSKQIRESALEGKVPGCEFGVKNTCMEDVEEAWGQADHTDYVAEAKGSFATYSSRNLVFGFNKGMQIFDIRSYDKSLQVIHSSDLTEVLGKPDMTRTYNGEDIIGYVMGDEFKIRFVFPAANDENPDPQLDHISVFYPQGTVNSMADDPGIEW